MAVVWRPCRDCINGTEPDGLPCRECDGTSGAWREPSPYASLVCGHLARSPLTVARVRCAACDCDVEVLDFARADEQRSRFAAEQDARADALELAPLWGWPEPPSAEKTRVVGERDAFVARLRRVASEVRARIRTRRAA